MRKMIHERDNGIAVKEQTFPGVGIGDIAQLIRGNVKLFGKNLPVAARLIEHINEIRVLENVLNFA